MPRKSSRRDLIKGAGVATVAAAFWYPSGKVLGANDRVNLAVIGIRGQGGAHIGGFPKLPGVHLKTLCDIDENNFADKRWPRCEKNFKYKPEHRLGHAAGVRRQGHPRRHLRHRPTTGTRWPASGPPRPASTSTSRSPPATRVWEGRQMVNAARKHKVLMQVGFQNRSRKNTTAAIKFMKDGKLGKVYRARGLCFKPRAATSAATPTARWPPTPSPSPW